MTALTLALLCIFTIGAGAAVAKLMPARLALFQLPQVSAHRRAVLAGSLSDAGGTAGGQAATSPAPGALAAALSPLLSSGSLGERTGALVVNLASGKVLYSLDASSGFTPA